MLRAQYRSAEAAIRATYDKSSRFKQPARTFAFQTEDDWNITGNDAPGCHSDKRPGNQFKFNYRRFYRHRTDSGHAWSHGLCLREDRFKKIDQAIAQELCRKNSHLQSKGLPCRRPFELALNFGDGYAVVLAQNSSNARTSSPAMSCAVDCSIMKRCMR